MTLLAHRHQRVPRLCLARRHRFQERGRRTHLHCQEEWLILGLRFEKLDCKVARRLAKVELSIAAKMFMNWLRMRLPKILVSAIEPITSF